MSERSEVLQAALRAATSKSERREITGAFMSNQPSTAEVREFARADAEFRNLIRTGLQGSLYETRAASEGSATGGGNLVPIAFAKSVVWWLKDFENLIADCEDLETPNGQEWQRPQVSAFTAAGSAISESTQLSDASASLVAFNGVQDFPKAPTYAALLLGSLQLLQDSLQPTSETSGWVPLGPGSWKTGMPTSAPFETLGDLGNGSLTTLLAQAAATAIGRQLIVAAQAALASGMTAGQEFALTTLSAQSLAKLIAGIDPAYLPGAKFYMNSNDASVVFGSTAGILANADGMHLFGLPVVVCNGPTNFVSGTAGSGPILANLGAWLSYRHAGSIGVQILSERFADSLQFGIRVMHRASFLTTGAVASCAYSK